MASLTSQILIVDDNDLWFQAVSTILKADSSLEIIGSTSDHFEATQLTMAFQPAIVLLDIGLPKLSGIQLGEQIRTLSPGTKIVFVSTHADVDIVRAAIGLGQSAYVLKSDAGVELVPAIYAVIRGDSFLSRGVAHCRLSHS